MDEAFLPLSELLPGLLPALPDLYDPDAGVRTRVTGLDVETPVELDIVVDAYGVVRLGGTPPIYHIATSTLPVFHAIRLVAVRGEEEPG
ncbi:MULTISPECIES: hypothetical protein [unclassified Mycobacterium]|uniref:hypothetical protein n=1 Tax=unclassified Mycobacterium TaxID=2642494 RepID=UPI00089A5F43|nr:MULTISPECIES: hypothetical protein [unclassified Mycobacterium]SEA04237.1 hypothetical protein SAMN04488580_101552 [Mycobacterium sp. 283mftsu]